LPASSEKDAGSMSRRGSLRGVVRKKREQEIGTGGGEFDQVCQVLVERMIGRRGEEAERGEEARCSRCDGSGNASAWRGRGTSGRKQIGERRNYGSAARVCPRGGQRVLELGVSERRQGRKKKTGVIFEGHSFSASEILPLGSLG